MATTVISLEDVSKLGHDIKTTTEQKRQIWDRAIAAIRRDGGKHYNQDLWTEDKYVEGPCGTTACIAGHAVHAAVALGVLPPFRRCLWDLDWPAMKLLGLSVYFKNAIFMDIDESLIDGHLSELLVFLEQVRDNCGDSGKLDELAAEFTRHLVDLTRIRGLIDDAKWRRKMDASFQK